MKIIYNTLFSKNIFHFTLNLESHLQLYRCNSMVVLGGAHTEFCVRVPIGFPESHTLHSERLGRWFFFFPEFFISEKWSCCCLHVKSTCMGWGFSA